jgi:hypothetical protein
VGKEVVNKVSNQSNKPIFVAKVKKLLKSAEKPA